MHIFRGRFFQVPGPFADVPLVLLGTLLFDAMTIPVQFNLVEPMLIVKLKETELSADAGLLNF